MFSQSCSRRKIDHPCQRHLESPGPSRQRSIFVRRAEFGKRVSAIGQLKYRNDLKIDAEEANTMPTDSHSLPTRTAPPCITGKKITRPDTNIPNRRLNMPIGLSRRHKKLIGNP
jgi:hypothetical protein